MLRGFASVAAGFPCRRFLVRVPPREPARTYGHDMSCPSLGSPLGAERQLLYIPRVDALNFSIGAAYREIRTLQEPVRPLLDFHQKNESHFPPWRIAIDRRLSLNMSITVHIWM